jgi:hypothetical protein
MRIISDEQLKELLVSKQVSVRDYFSKPPKQKKEEAQPVPVFDLQSKFDAVSSAIDNQAELLGRIVDRIPEEPKTTSISINRDADGNIITMQSSRFTFSVNRDDGKITSIDVVKKA